MGLLAEQGTEVVYVVVTNGDKGCSNPFCMNYTAEKIAETRQEVMCTRQHLQEQWNAAKVFNIPQDHVVMLDYEDTMATSYPEQQLRIDIVTAIRRWKPAVIMSWFPYPELSLQPTPVCLVA